MNQRWAKPKIIANFRALGKSSRFQYIGCLPRPATADVVYDAHANAFGYVDKLLISLNSLPFFLSTVHKK